MLRMINFIKQFFCKHDSGFIYDGVGGGLGFLFRKIHCEKCKKKFESLTFQSSFTDGYKKGQKLTKDDIDFFNSEIK